jgi:tetratricopeptide (TPR) repeat protein
MTFRNEISPAGLRTPPTLLLPAALLRLGGDFPAERLAKLAGAALALPGVELLESLPGGATLALRPLPGRADLFAAAAELGRELAAAFLQNGVKFPGCLVFPGRISAGSRQVEACGEQLLGDLQAAMPELRGQLAATAHVSHWLAGDHALSPLPVYEGASGRRVPLFAVGDAKPEPALVHNPEVLGRRPRVARPELLAALRQAFAENDGLRLVGACGAGKSHAALALLEALGATRVCRVALDAGLPGRPRLAAALASWLASRWSGAVSLVPEEDPAAAADALAAALVRYAAASGEKAVLLLDGLQAASPFDRALLAALVPALLERGAARLLLLEQSGHAPAVDLPSVVVDKFDAAEAEEAAGQLLARLELPAAIRGRLVEAAGGNPLALEEQLLRLAHRGLMRRIHGSFFYAGGEALELDVSLRYCAALEAAAGCLCPALPLRVLALADGRIEPGHLIETCGKFGLDLPWGFESALLEADILEADRLEAGDGGLRFRTGALRGVFADSVAADGARSLRHALGGVLAESDRHLWPAYRLLAGTPDALPSLLDVGRGAEKAPREEVFNALFTEYRELQNRRGDEATELEILWTLLPLARRLGCLGNLERELQRGIELAAGEPARWVALVALQAEHEQDRGRPREAEAGFRLALAASDGLDEARRATLLVRLGALLHRQERWSEAREIFESLLVVEGRRGATQLGATCHFYLGNIALHQGRLAHAAEHHQLAAGVRRDRSAWKPLGASLTAQAAVALAQGDPARALQCCSEAEELVQRHESGRDELGFVLLGKGRALAQLGDLQTAQKTLRQALELRRNRDDLLGEAVVRLELGLLASRLGQLAAALDEGRRAHFQLSLAGPSSLLGQVERLLGCILLQQRNWKEAEDHLNEAIRIHARRGDQQEHAHDLAWRLELGLQQGGKASEVFRDAAALERLLEELPHPAGGELLFFRLHQGLAWLEKNGFEVHDKLGPLRRAYQELLRKTQFLEPGRRHQFLFQIVENQQILDAATRQQISLPVLTFTRQSILEAG